MQLSWSLVLNVLLLMGVLFAIVRLIRSRKKNLNKTYNDAVINEKVHVFQDEVIAVRKISIEEQEDVKSAEAEETACAKVISAGIQEKPKSDEPIVLMMFLMAKENRHFAGYEMLQTVLAAGLRFGEGQLFHRHQFANGQGPVLCSLAAATNSGTFDLQNIGAFSVRGLCLFMEASNNPSIDEERFTIMLDTARQLSEGLDALLLDDKRRPLTEQRTARYYQLLNLQPSESLQCV